MKLRAKLFAASIVAAAALAPLPAHALLCGTFLSPVKVTATALSFGTYNAALPDDTADSTISISCQLLNLDILPSFTVSLSGSSPSASFFPRVMTMGGETLQYNIYTTSGFGSVWGDSTHGVTQSYSTLLLLHSIPITAHGRILSGQYVPAGTYHDTITVTVTW